MSTIEYAKQRDIEQQIEYEESQRRHLTLESEELSMFCDRCKDAHVRVKDLYLLGRLEKRRKGLVAKRERNPRKGAGVKATKRRLREIGKQIRGVESDIQTLRQEIMARIEKHKNNKNNESRKKVRQQQSGSSRIG